MKLLARTFLFLTAAASLAACGAPPSEGAASPAPRRDPNLITREEIDASGASNALDLVRTQRPRWLQKRGLSTTRTVEGGGAESPEQTAIIVYVDDVKMGDEMALRGVNLPLVRWMRYLDATTATQRYGTGHSAGAIVISTRDRG